MSIAVMLVHTYTATTPAAVRSASGSRSASHGNADRRGRHHFVHLARCLWGVRLTTNLPVRGPLKRTWRETDARRTTVRLAAAVLADLKLAFAVLTYLSYTAAWRGDRHGHGIVTPGRTGDGEGRPRSNTAASRSARSRSRPSSYSGDQARLTLGINSSDMHYGFFPSNATVHIAGNTISGPRRWNSFRARTLADLAPPRTRTWRASAVQLGSQHPVPVADRPAAQDRPGRTQRGR